MKPKELFGLAIRLLGLYFLYLAARHAPSIWNGPGSQILPEAFNTAFFGAVAWWLIGGAPLLMYRAYPGPGEVVLSPSGQKIES